MTNKFLLLLVASIIVVMAFTVDLFLTCTPYTDIAEIGSYDEVSQLGSRYINKGSWREFLVLAVWQPKKATHCYELAYQSYDRAVELRPNHRGAYQNRANTLSSLGAYEAALDDFYHILTLNENDQHARLGIARSYERLGEVETAVIKYEEALEFMESSAYWLQLHSNRIEETRSHIERLRRSLE
jgi:tetratricopeptide (TPR) repeat protein